MGDAFAFPSGGRSNTILFNKRFSSSPGGAVRKSLMDITNVGPNPKPNAELISIAKENEALKKENLVLKMQIAERNKITELSATELHNLRLNLQSLYQQNVQLAQINTQMLIELNSGKDRLKALNHEVGCLKGVLSAKTLALQVANKAVDCRKRHKKAPTTMSEAADEAVLAEKTSSRKLSKGQSAINATNEKAVSENKRSYVRRQSSRFKSEEPSSADDLLEVDNVISAVNALPDKEKSENKRCILSRFKSEEPSSTDDLLKLDNVISAANALPDKEKSENKRLRSRGKSSRFKPEESASTEHLNKLEEPASTENLSKPDDDKSAANAIPDKEKSENKRRCVRRQSLRFKPEEPEPASTEEDLFELDDIKLPMQSQGDETASGLSFKGLDAAALNSTGSLSSEGRRSSFGRPSRRAAVNIRSYKEIKVNAKMRNGE